MIQLEVGLKDDPSVPGDSPLYPSGSEHTKREVSFGMCLPIAQEVSMGWEVEKISTEQQIMTQRRKGSGEKEQINIKIFYR